MEAIVYNEIISLFQEMKNIFLQFTDLLDREKRSIISIDIDQLWHFTKEKNSKAKEVEAIRETILNILSDESIEHGMNITSFSMTKVLDHLPTKVARALEPLRIELITLTKEITLRVEDNQTFIKEYLKTVDEMTSIIMGTNTQQVNSNTYSSRCVSNYLQHNGV